VCAGRFPYCLADVAIELRMTAHTRWCIVLEFKTKKIIGFVIGNASVIDQLRIVDMGEPPMNVVAIVYGLQETRGLAMEVFFRELADLVIFLHFLKNFVAIINLVVLADEPPAMILPLADRIG
jgi:hypothetical protein